MAKKDEFLRLGDVGGGNQIQQAAPASRAVTQPVPNAAQVTSVPVSGTQGGGNGVVSTTAASQASDGRPTYQSQNAEQMNYWYNQIVNRPAFSYNAETDPLYQNYRDQYIAGGQRAMTDTMGKAAGLTGGYGSTYSEAVGQQQYNAYLQELNGKALELYGLARDNYNQDRDYDLQMYGLASDRENQDYSRYMDSYNQWWSEKQAAQEQANWQAEMDFQREQWNWQKAQAAARSSGSGGSRGSSSGGGSGSSGESGASGSGEAQNQPMRVFPGGYTENDIGGMAAAWVNNDGNVRARYGTLDAFLRSLGVQDSGALTYAHDIIKYYGG